MPAVLCHWQTTWLARRSRVHIPPIPSQPRRHTALGRRERKRAGTANGPQRRSVGAHRGNSPRLGLPHASCPHMPVTLTGMDAPCPRAPDRVRRTVTTAQTKTSSTSGRPAGHREQLGMAAFPREGGVTTHAGRGLGGQARRSPVPLARPVILFTCSGRFGSQQPTRAAHRRCTPWEGRRAQRLSEHDTRGQIYRRWPGGPVACHPPADSVRHMGQPNPSAVRGRSTLL